MKMIDLASGRVQAEPGPSASCGCGGAASPDIGKSIPGYSLCGFVEGFSESPAGPVPGVSTRLSLKDWAGAAFARLGPGRQDYTVSPGLYAVGGAGSDSPVLVTANYKLTFDALRKELSGISAWILVLDTEGVNVWCSAGKGTFSSEEVCRRVAESRLDAVVSHRELILPQLGAPGVSARDVRKTCGFSVSWGPVRASDIRAYLGNGKKAGPEMRSIDFPLLRRLVLIPVEVSFLALPTLVVLAAALVLSAIGAGFGAAPGRGLTLFYAYALAVLAGAVAVPALLPMLPGRAFSVKGAITGAVAGLFAAIFWKSRMILPEMLAVMALSTVLSSYLAMNFTGATPITSPSGVEMEMRKAIPLQVAGLALAIGLWVTAGFLR